MNVTLTEDDRRRALHRKVVWLLAAALVVLHHDFWWWDSRHLVLGVLPITIAWHMAFSLAAGALWIYAIRFAWPAELEKWADEADSPRAAEPPVDSAEGAGR